MNEGFVVTRLKQLCEERGWSDYRLGKICGIPNSTIHNILHRVSSPSIPSLMKICDGMGITMAQFFSEGESVELTEEQRELLEWYNSLNAQGQERVMAYVKGVADGQQITPGKK